MTFMLRDRPDGLVEIIVERPVLVGIFPERDTAEKVRAFLQAEDDEPPEEPPLFSTTATTVVGEAESQDLVAAFGAANLDENVVSVPRASKPKRRSKSAANLPVVVDQPQAPPMVVYTPPETLTEAQLAQALARLEEGERLSTVASDIGISWPRLRGIWAQNRRMLQKHMAEGGFMKCRLCSKPFIPSISNPETCARCSHE